MSRRNTIESFWKKVEKNGRIPENTHANGEKEKTAITVK